MKEKHTGAVFTEKKKNKICVVLKKCCTITWEESRRKL